ncbi:MAG: response regulator [Microcoleaceae cyanobacterium]
MTIDTNDQAYIFFIQESLELLQVLEQGLMTLNQEHDLSKLHNLMRAAHSIKGGAACVGLDGIQQIAHELENAIRALYPEDTVFDTELEDLLLRGFDCLRLPLTEQIETGNCDEAIAFSKAQPIFSKIETKIGRPLEEAAELPEVPMQSDMTLFLFQEEVPTSLRRLESLVHQTPQPASFMSDLIGQVEVLGTLGNMLHLQGFLAIAKTTIQAIHAYPKEIVTIVEQALVDFWLGQQAVLAGDRISGGQPGPGLLSWIESGSSTLESQDSMAFVNETSETETELIAAAIDAVDSTAVETVDLSTLTEVASEDDLASVAEALAELDLENSEAFSEAEEPLGLDEEFDRELNTESTASSKAQSELTPQPVLIPSHQRKADPAAPNLGIRVDLYRLGKIDTLVGELTTQDNAFLLQNQQHKASVAALSRTWHKFKKIIIQLQGLTEMIDPMLELTEDLHQDSIQNSHTGSLAQLIHQMGLSSESLEKTLSDAEKIDQTLYEMRLNNLRGQQLLKKRQNTLQQVQQQLTETRMVPVAALLDRFPRMVRDLSSQKQKQVTLELEGQNTLIDKAVLEKLYDPLVHIVRNAFDHGIESAEIRRAKGKPEQGKIQVNAYQEGNYTYLEIRDDGQGINLEQVRQKAIRQRLVSATDVHKLSTEQLYDLLFVPGFSTTETITDLSGRGAGLDAVRHQIESLRGLISIQSESGKGTKFTLQLPWMLTVTKLLIFQIGGNLFAIPMDTLSTIISAPNQDIASDQGQEIYHWLGQKVPLIQSCLLGYRYPGLQRNLSKYQSPEHQSSESHAQDNGFISNNSARNRNALNQTTDQSLVLLLSKDLETIGLKIEQIVMEQNLAIKPFSSVLNPPSYFYGCTTLGDGRLVPVIDTPRLLDTWLQQRRAEREDEKLLLIPQSIPLHLEPQATLLLIDDSITTRQSLSSTLNQAGYRVIQARHGREGLQQLEQYSGIQLVICDLEMPEMNGFEFLTHCRRQFAKEQLPVLMLTSRNSDRYRQLAQQLGSNGYITKPWERENLLDLLQSLLLA